MKEATPPCEQQVIVPFGINFERRWNELTATNDTNTYSMSDDDTGTYNSGTEDNDT